MTFRCAVTVQPVTLHCAAKHTHIIGYCCLGRPINVSHNRGNSLSLTFSANLDGHRSIVVCCRVFLLLFVFLLFSFYCLHCNSAHFPTLSHAGVRQRRHTTHTHVICNLDFVVVFILEVALNCVSAERKSFVTFWENAKQI